MRLKTNPKRVITKLYPPLNLHLVGSICALYIDYSKHFLGLFICGPYLHDIVLVLVMVVVHAIVLILVMVVVQKIVLVQVLEVVHEIVLVLVHGSGT